MLVRKVKPKWKEASSAVFFGIFYHLENFFSAEAMKKNCKLFFRDPGRKKSFDPHFWLKFCKLKPRPCKYDDFLSPLIFVRCILIFHCHWTLKKARLLLINLKYQLSYNHWNRTSLSLISARTAASQQNFIFWAQHLYSTFPKYDLLRPWLRLSHQ